MIIINNNVIINMANDKYMGKRYTYKLFKTY